MSVILIKLIRLYVCIVASSPARCIWCVVYTHKTQGIHLPIISYCSPLFLIIRVVFMTMLTVFLFYYWDGFSIMLHYGTKLYDISCLIETKMCVFILTTMFNEIWRSYHLNVSTIWHYMVNQTWSTLITVICLLWLFVFALSYESLPVMSW